MIKSSFLQKQIKKAHKEKRTPNFLRRLTFLIVDTALKKHYPESYPMKCLQSAIAINLVLERFGIKSRAYIGEVCVAQVFDTDNNYASWNGFWGEDHHVWSCNEFGEYIDLTIRYLHIHPATNRTGQIPMPAIWWEDTVDWPMVIKYLYQGPVDPKLPVEEMKDLEDFKRSVASCLDDYLEKNSVQNVEFQPIIHGTKSMNELYEQGNLWLQKSLIFQEQNVQFPQRIQEREKELVANYEKQN